LILPPRRRYPPHLAPKPGACGPLPPSPALQVKRWISLGNLTFAEAEAGLERRLHGFASEDEDSQPVG
jgi:hypothetical protein